MAFCPNCGTPNTEQVEKCVACGFELAVPKQKAKFKGTIMMSGIKAPTAPGAEGSAEPAASPSEPKPSTPPGGSSLPPPSPAATNVGKDNRNLAYQKTMMGHAPVVVPPPARPAPREPEPPASNTSASSSSEPQIIEPDDDTPELSFESPSQASSSPIPPAAPPPPREIPAPSAPARDSVASGSYLGPNAPRAPSQTGVGGYDSTLPPSAAPSTPKAGKVIAIGCGVALALFCVVGGILYYVVGEKIRSLMGDDDGSSEAAAWQASIVQSLAQVSEICKTDCVQAGVYFHAQREAALLGEARALTPERLQKLSDSAQTEATMLNGTDDEAAATKLGLDPQQCARVSVGSAKVISCSVPDPSGKPSVLRIVELAGIGSL